MFLFEILVKSWIEEYISLNISLPTILLKNKSPLQLFSSEFGELSEQLSNRTHVLECFWAWLVRDSIFIEAATRGVLWNKGVLRNSAKFTGKQLWQSLFFNKVASQACNFVKKETLAQVFSWEVCEISKSTFLQNTSGRLLL